MSIDLRIAQLERKVPGVAGTILQRTLDWSTGLMWTLGVGVLQEPKEFFEGATIEECLQKAEEHYGIQ